MISLDDNALEMSYDFASHTATIVLASPVVDDVIIAYFHDLSLTKARKIEVWINGDLDHVLTSRDGFDWTKAEP